MRWRENNEKKKNENKNREEEISWRTLWMSAQRAQHTQVTELEWILCLECTTNSSTDALHSSIRSPIKLKSHNQANWQWKVSYFFGAISRNFVTEILPIIIIIIATANGKPGEMRIFSLAEAFEAEQFTPPFSLCRECVAEVVVQTPGWPIVWKKSAGIPLFSLIIQLYHRAERDHLACRPFRQCKLSFRIEKNFISAGDATSFAFKRYSHIDQAARSRSGNCEISSINKSTMQLNVVEHS